MGKHSYSTQANAIGIAAEPTASRELIPRTIRKWLYNIVLAALPLLSAIGVVADELTPAIIGLAGAVLAVGTARGYLTPETDGGVYDEPAR